MAMLVWARGFKIPDGSVAAKVTRFFIKLSEDHTARGLHVEPIRSAADPRVRTARVDDFYRAVMFQIDFGAEVTFLIAGIYSHDDAIATAQKLRLQLNPLNGVPELIEATAPPISDAPAAPYQPAAPTQPAPVPARPATPAAPAPTTPTPKPTPKPRPPRIDLLRVSAAQPVPQPAPWSNPLHLHGVTEYDLDEVGVDPRLAQRILAATSETAYHQLINATTDEKGLAILELAGGKSAGEVAEALRVQVRTVVGAPAPADLIDPKIAAALRVKGFERIEANEKIQAVLDLPREQRAEQLAAPTDELLLAGLKTERASRQFLLTSSGDEIREVLEHGTFTEWRTFLHPDQRRYVTHDNTGPFRLTGGAGTGKTVVLVHRADHLARANPNARIVLTTFTTTLANALTQQVRTLNPGAKLTYDLGHAGILVRGVDSLASQVMKSASPAEVSAAFAAVLGTPPHDLQANLNGDRSWQQALENARLSPEQYNPALMNSVFLDQEYVSVVLAQNITTLVEYARCPRPGRGTKLGRHQRVALWSVFEAYRRASQLEGKLLFSEIAALAAHVLAQRPAAPADHVLIDEAQDLHAAHWKLLRALVRPGRNDLFIATDGHQRIYGQRIVLSKFGISVVGRRSKTLTLNYRTTAEILNFAVGLLAGHTFDEVGSEEFSPEDNADELGEYRSAMSGPRPRLIEARSFDDEIAAIAETLQGWSAGEHQSIGILVRQRSDISRIHQALNERGIPARMVESGGAADTNEPLVMTMHRAKGMEFSHVIVAGVSDRSMPTLSLPKHLADAEREEALQRERALLYVAVTRARDELVITYSGTRSELIDL